MFMEFSEDCQKILMQAKKEMIALKSPYVGSEHFLLAILRNGNLELTARLSKYGIDYNSFRTRLVELIGYGVEENTWFVFTPLLKRVIENAMLEAKDRNMKTITVESVFLSLLEEGEGIGIRVLMSLGLVIDKFYNESISCIRKYRKIKNKNSFLEEFGVDLVNQALKNKLDPTIGRDKEIEQIIEILVRRKKNNPLLIGSAGVGKTAVVEELARRIANGNVPDVLKNKRIISISMASLVSGTKYRGEFEERINKIIKEVEKNRDYILFIDEIHTLVGAGGADGAIDASNILKPVLSRGGFSLIGATTKKEYRLISQDKALERRFQTVLIDEPNIDRTVFILKKIKNIYEQFYNLKISNNILEEIVYLTNQYVHKNHQPDKAIEVLDSACCKASLTKTKLDKDILKARTKLESYILKKKDDIASNNFDDARAMFKQEKLLKKQLDHLNLKQAKSMKKDLTIEDVVSTIEEKTGVSLAFFCKEKKSLKPLLKNKIIGQDEAIDDIVLETNYARYKKDSTRPLSFLFVGPTGVGKTYTAEVYHHLLYGDKPLIRLDMSEYRESSAINKMLGSPAGYVGYNDGNSVLKQVEDNPNTVLLLDEIEKAHPSVLNLFLQILDYGKIKDAIGEEICFSHTTIIMTSNIGCNSAPIGFCKTDNSAVINKLKKYLSVEFINRIQRIVLFKNLDDNSILKIINKKWKEEKSKYRFVSINHNLSKKKKDRILESSNYKEYGARQIDKYIEQEFESIFLSMNGTNISS